MAHQSLQAALTSELLTVLRETFENVSGIYLDKGTSLFETLASISAEEASRRVLGCASIAAQVEHTRFYLETIMQFMRGENPKVDWTEIWRTVHTVTAEEWTGMQQRLQDTYQQTRDFLTTTVTWDESDEIGDALGLLAHSAFHLGQIRQALCFVKP